MSLYRFVVFTNAFVAIQSSLLAFFCVCAIIFGLEPSPLLWAPLAIGLSVNCQYAVSILRSIGAGPLSDRMNVGE